MQRLIRTWCCGMLSVVVWVMWVQTEEYKKLKSEIKNTSRAAVVETGEKAKQRKVRATVLVDPEVHSAEGRGGGAVGRGLPPRHDFAAFCRAWNDAQCFFLCGLIDGWCGQAEQGYREMLTPLEQRRQKYLERKRQASGNR